MKRTFSMLTVAAASCVLFASAVEAARVVERRVTTTTTAPVIGERTVTTTEIAEPVFRGPVVSGTTLSGRREVRSNDAIITPTGDGQVTIQDSRGTRTFRPRGFLNPGAMGGGTFEVEPE